MGAGRDAGRDGVARREFLRRTALLGLGAALASRSGVLDALTGQPAAASVVPASLQSIEHVVILMQENRSYDHYFGAYPKGRGFDDHPKHSLGPFAQKDTLRRTASPRQVLLPWHLDTATMNAACTADISHEWSAQHLSWNGGAMDGFVAARLLPEASGPLTMGYYTRADLPFYYALADAFTICDHYFCSVMGPSDPNRLYSMSASIDPDGRAGGPVPSNGPDVNLAPPANIVDQARYSWTTMPERLQAGGVSWKVYQAPGSLSATMTTNNILTRFTQYRDPASELYRNAFLPIFPHDFEADVAAGTLPSVSWLNSKTPGSDEHPPYAPNVGERVVGRVVQALVRNPKVWSKTVLFVTFDENGGFFDHVAPPTPPAGTAGEYIADPALLPPLAHGITGPIGLGFRVPMIVVSPFSRGGHVNSDAFDHTSLLRLLETRFGVEVPNLSDWRRQTVSDLTSTLRFEHEQANVPNLPVQGLTDKVVDRECAHISSPPQPPRRQRMPTQGP
jgi:phospholipase C